jgi:hypothetical protein
MAIGPFQLVALGFEYPDASCASLAAEVTA